MGGVAWWGGASTRRRCVRMGSCLPCHRIQPAEFYPHNYMVMCLLLTWFVMLTMDVRRTYGGPLDLQTKSGARRG
jgi:hypothetical protein